MGHSCLLLAAHPWLHGHNAAIRLNAAYLTHPIRPMHRKTHRMTGRHGWRETRFNRRPILTRPRNEAPATHDPPIDLGHIETQNHTHRMQTTVTRQHFGTER